LRKPNVRCLCSTLLAVAVAVLLVPSSCRRQDDVSGPGGAVSTAPGAQGSQQKAAAAESPSTPAETAAAVPTATPAETAAAVPTTTPAETAAAVPTATPAEAPTTEPAVTTPTSDPPPPQPVELPPDTKTLAVIQTSDLHGYILPQKVLIRPGEKKEDGYTADMGGSEWFAGYLKIAREHYPGRVLLLDGGDMFQGTVISNRFEGATVIEAMMRLGYAAAVVGNHEFDFGPVGEGTQGDPFGALKERGAQAGFPLLAGNTIDRTTGNPVAWPGFAPYALVTVDGIKVGIVGGPTQDTAVYSGEAVGAGLEFLPLAQTLVQYAPVLREAGARIIIGLVHAGGVCEKFDNEYDLSTCEPDEEMFRIARALPPGTVDLLIGGHTHQILAHRVNGIPILQAGAKGVVFSMAEIHYSPAIEKVVRVDIKRPVGICHYHFRGEDDCAFIDHIPTPERVPATFLGQEVTAVPFLQEIFSEEQRKVLADAQEKLGPRAVRRIERPDQGIDHPVGLLTTRVLLDSFPEAQIAMLNESGIRAALPEGELTYSDIFEVFPFDSSVALVRMPGDLLLDLLRLASSGAHGLPVVRGLRLVIDRARDDCIAQDWDGRNGNEKWERNLLVSATLEDGSPITSDGTFTIIMSSYLAHGGSDFKRILSKLPEGSISFLPDAPPVRDLVVRWLRVNPVELGGPGDPYTTSPDGKPLVTILNWDHVLGSGCAQPRSESP